VNVEPILGLFRQELTVLNLGLSAFAENLRANGAEAVQLAWKPPAGGGRAMLEALDRIGDQVEGANRRAAGIILAGRPMLVGLGAALDAVPGMTPATVLHPGPPIAWARMGGPLRAAVVAGLLREGLARTGEEAAALASGGVRFAPCHDHQAVAPAAGVITAGTPVWIVADAASGRRAFCPLAPDAGSPAGLARVLDRALRTRGPVDLKALLAQALSMGDDGRDRNRAAASLFIRALAPALAGLDEPGELRAGVLAWLDAGDGFFLRLSMAACKCILDPARGVAGSTVVVAMACNGTEFGIRVAGLGDRWFTGPAPAEDPGDAAVAETAGLGSFCLATSQDALQCTARMRQITAAEDPCWTLFGPDPRGAPTGIDLRKVVETGILPAIGAGAAGPVKPPLSSFREALAAFAENGL